MGTGTKKKTDVSLATLERTPAQVMTFLFGVGNSNTIRSLLATKGYTSADHEEGWTLLRACDSMKSGQLSTFANEDFDVDTRKAIATLNAWDEDGFDVAQRALERKFPEQAEFLFDNLEASTDPTKAVLGVATFLDRLDALESSPDRKSTRKTDVAALKLLAARGIDESERKRLRELVNRATRASYVAPATPAPDPKIEQDAREEKLQALRGWYLEWVAVAKSVLKRKDYLIRVGLASRASRESEEEKA